MKTETRRNNMITFDNTTEPLARLNALRQRAEAAESNAAGLAAELQATRIKLSEIAKSGNLEAMQFLREKGLTVWK